MSLLQAREVIFPNYNCIDPITGNLETTVGHTSDNSCNSDDNCNGIYCEWTNIRSYISLDVMSTTEIQSINTTDWLQNPSDMISGDYTFRLYWPIKDVDGNPVSYDNAIIKNEITFKLKREACIDSDVNVICDSGYNPFSEIDCSGHYIDTVSCSTTCSGGYMDTEDCSTLDDCLDHSCCTYQDLFGNCCLADYCGECISGYVCIDQNPITEVFESDECENNCDIQYCQQLDNLYNDFPYGIENNGNPIWNGNCGLILGDVNNDNFENVIDGLYIINHILGVEPIIGSYISLADMNENYMISVSEIIILVEHILSDEFVPKKYTHLSGIYFPQA